jgi:hypothetical protein
MGNVKQSLKNVLMEVINLLEEHVRLPREKHVEKRKRQALIDGIIMQ